MREIISNWSDLSNDRFSILIWDGYERDYGFGTHHSQLNNYTNFLILFFTFFISFIEFIFLKFFISLIKLKVKELHTKLYS